MLVGAVLAQNIETSLNKQLKEVSANLKAINLKAEIDTKSIEDAFKNIDFTNADQSAKAFTQTMNTEVSAAMDTIGNKTQNVVDGLKNANIEARELANILNSIDDVNIRANVNNSTGNSSSNSNRNSNSNSSLQNDAEQIRRLQSQADRLIDHVNRQVNASVTRLRSQYGELFNEGNYGSLFTDVNMQAEVLRQRLNSGEMSADELTDRIRQLRTAMQGANDRANEFRSDLAASARQARELNNQAGILNNTLGRFMQFYGLGEIFRGVKTATVSILTNIKDIDSSMVELKKVTEETDYTYERFLDGSAQKAKDLGITMTDYIDAVTNFARMDVGGFEAAQEVAEVANIMQQVSESLTADQASEYLISTMKGFGYEADNAIEIVDILNNLDRGSYIEIYRQTVSFYRKTS